MQTLLLAYAHPDDETFTCGGTIARFKEEQRGPVVLYCATRGEAGSPGNPPLCPREYLGHHREQELMRAAAVLGIDEVVLRDFGDGRLADHPPQRLAEDVAVVIRRVQPDVVITFPPHGISGHRDHRAIQAAARIAAEASKAADSIRLYRTVLPRSAAKPAPNGVHMTPGAEVTHQVDVTAYRETIMRALQAHRSQHVSIDRVFPGVMQGRWEGLRRTEFYQAVHPWKSIPPGCWL